MKFKLSKPKNKSSKKAVSQKATFSNVEGRGNDRKSGKNEKKKISVKKKALSAKEFYEEGIEESQKELLRKQWKAPPPEAVAPENLILLREIRADNREYLLEAYWSGKGYAMRVPETKRYYFIKSPDKERPPFFESVWKIPHPSPIRRILSLGFAQKKVWIPTLEYHEGNLNPIDFSDLPDEEREWLEQNNDAKVAKEALEKAQACFFDFRNIQPDIASGVEIEMTTDVARTGAFLFVTSQQKHRTTMSVGIIIAIIIAIIVVYAVLSGVMG